MPSSSRLQKLLCNDGASVEDKTEETTERRSEPRPQADEPHSVSAALLFVLISYEVVLLFLRGLTGFYFLEKWAARSSLGKAQAL